MRFHRAAHLDRESRAPGAVDVDHQLALWPQRVADSGDPRQILARLDLAEFGVADQFAPMRLGRGVAADLHLHALEAADAIGLGFGREVGGGFALLVEAARGIGLDPVAAAAEQPVDRHVGDLAGDVPQRDVDAADRLHDEPAPAVLPGAGEHLLPEMLDQ